MIETRQSVRIAVPIGAVWDYARDMERWAEIMPGYQSCEIIDADNSRWILKVGVGAMVRTVRVRVTVNEWAGPERVAFTFRLDGDPVEGGGSYFAVADGAHTDVTLHVTVTGSGPMAPMWEAMGAPVLPKFAAAFAQQLKQRIEDANPAENPAVPAPAASARPGLITRLFTRLRTWLGGLLGKRSRGTSR